MKSRKFDKKLVLNKKTVANLNRYEMKDLNGGGDAPTIPILDETVLEPTCAPGCTDNCCTQTTSNYPGAACC